ncbi:MAG: outer membrane beta-barrel protein [Crocinitomicaceae bacterium]
MKKTIVLLAILLPLLCAAQDSLVKKSKFSFGVNFSPNYSSNTLNYDKQWQPYVDAVQQNEKPAFGFNTGLSARYHVLDKLELELGVQYARQTRSFKSIALTDMNGQPLGKVDFQNRFNYLEIPVRVNYLLIKNKFFGYITAGASLNVFLNDQAKSWLTFDSGYKEVQTAPTGYLFINKSTISLIGGFGIGYHLSDKLNIRFEPLFRYSLTPVAEAPIKQHNYSVGGQVGINFQL